MELQRKWYRKKLASLGHEENVGRDKAVQAKELANSSSSVASVPEPSRDSKSKTPRKCTFRSFPPHIAEHYRALWALPHGRSGNQQRVVRDVPG